MSQFSYVASDANGRTVRGKEIADDYLDLIEKLRAKHIYCTSYREIEQKNKGDVKYKFKTADLAFMCRQLSSMLTAGISVVKALHILVTQCEVPKQKAVLTDIYEDVQKGRSFSEAISAKQGAFPNLFVSMVAAGEISGNLDVIMNRVSEHYAKENKLNNKIRGAMIYPCVLLVLMVTVVLALFAFIMPMFIEMFESPESMPFLTQILMHISNFITGQWYILIGVFIAIFIALRIILRTPSTRLKWDEMLCKMPKVGKLMCVIYTARFARTMSNLFASGMQMVDCIEKSVATLGNSYISKRFEEVVEDVKQGESLSVAITKTEIFEGIFTSIIFVGEESGTLDDILAKTADYYDEEADSAVSKLTALLEPCMIIFLGAAVGLILAGVFPALYGSFDNIS